MARLQALVALMAFAAGVNSQISMMIDMTDQLCAQCWANEESNISDEWFRMFASVNPKVFDDPSNPASRTAWNSVYCLYASAGVMDSEGKIEENMIPSVTNMLWPKKDGDTESEEINEKSTTILKTCSDEAFKANANPIDRTREFYKCAVDKGIPPFPAMTKYESYFKIVQSCLNTASDLKKEDFMSIMRLDKELNPRQTSYLICILRDGFSKDGITHVNAAHEIFELMPDKERGSKYIEVYNECVKSCSDCKEEYDLAKEEAEGQKYMNHLWPCMLNNMEEPSWDDFAAPRN